MSRVSDVMKNKGKIEKARSARRAEEIRSINEEAAYKNSLRNALRDVEGILANAGVKSVIVDVPNSMMAKFGAAIYGPELAEFSISQCEDSTTEFEIAHKVISI